MSKNRSRFFARIGFAALAAVGLLTSVHVATAASPPNLLGNFYGTYTSDRPGSRALTMQIEVESQHKRQARVSIFAVDQPEFRDGQPCCLTASTSRPTRVPRARTRSGSS